MLQWKGQKRNEFFFPFPENKEYKWAGLNSPSFFHFAPNSECLSLLFCPLTLQELHFSPIFFWLYAKYIPLSGVYPYNTLHLVVTYHKEGHRATELPDSITGLLMPAYGCLWNNTRGRNQDPLTFIPHQWLLTASPCLTQAPRLLVEWGAQFFRHKPTVSPLHKLRIKATFLFPPNSVSVFFIQL